MRKKIKGKAFLTISSYTMSGRTLKNMIEASLTIQALQRTCEISIIYPRIDPDNPEYITMPLIKPELQSSERVKI